MAFNLSLNLNKTNQIAGLALANVEALAISEINPECENGCEAEEQSGCYCNGYYEYYNEVYWN